MALKEFMRFWTNFISYIIVIIMIIDEKGLSSNKAKQ